MTEDAIEADTWQPTHDCGHECCDERSDQHHDHFLPPEKCPVCLKRGAS